jgi:hypothetical protein
MLTLALGGAVDFDQRIGIDRRNFRETGEPGVVNAFHLGG